MELTRRNFLAVAGAAAGGMGLAALPAQGTRALADEGEPAPRVYEGTAQGLRGELTAHIAPVSYTHLDVYKRQEKGGRLSLVGHIFSR